MDRRKVIATVFCMMLGAMGASAQTTAPEQNYVGGSVSSPALRQSSTQNQILGSVPTGTVSPQPISLSLADAIERGLRQNLGILVSDDTQLSARGQVWQARSPLLPDFSARISENAQKINLAAEGFSKIAGRFPGFPLLVGPFGYFDARLSFSQTLLDLNLLATERSSRQNAAAVKLSYQDMREAVVLVVGATYLQAIAAAARVDTADAQVQSAQALWLHRRQRIAGGEEATTGLECLAKLCQVRRVAAGALDRRAWRGAGLAAERIARARHHALHCANE